ncbi:protein of unknown function [Magnetospirillum sp. XM-1]|uniref:hypothetical protein n=1 Tax=Magnetospirillum sp. XM-1 TaxID=1663591 RepID=UPI00073DD084|nr:hypothetical protein [Magnetospirillum sp. XM-1]CUW39687.1 protein of unknown function [Magnetospirillum sp. XM-1]
MARIRTIKPEFWTSEQIVECSRDARLLFIGIWNICDDAGIHPAAPKVIKMRVFPADDDITSDSIRGMLDDLVRHRLIAFFDSDGTEYLRVTGWSKHQKVERPNYKYPNPDAISPNNGGKERVNAESSRRSFDDSSPNDHRSIGDRSTPEGKGKEGKGRESPPSPPRQVPSAAPSDAVDRVRKLVWTLIGKDQGWIGTKLVSTDVEGVRQVRGWFDLGLSEDRVLAEVERVFTAAKESGTSIGRPWAYLDRVMRSLAEEGSATAEAGGNGILDATPWVQRVESFRSKGFWVDGWGPRPGEDGCLVPADVLASHGYGARA